MSNGVYEKTKDFLRLNLFFFVVALACVVYIVRGFVEIVETGKTVWEIIADGFVSALFGFLISKLLSLQGLEKGSKAEEVMDTNLLHSKTVLKITPKIYLLDEWCEMKNKEALRIEQSKILATSGISYEDFKKGLYRTITLEGEKYLPEQALDKVRRKTIKKARKIRLTPLTASSLTADGEKANDPYNFGLNKKEFALRRDGRQIISKIMCGVLFGFYGVRLITEFNVANLIWTAIQVVLFLVMGVISFLQAYSFVTDEYRARIIRKIDNLIKFDNEVTGLMLENFKGEKNEKLDEVV